MGWDRRLLRRNIPRRIRECSADGAMRDVKQWAIRDDTLRTGNDVTHRSEMTENDITVHWVLYYKTMIPTDARLIDESDGRNIICSERDAISSFGRYHRVGCNIIRSMRCNIIGSMRCNIIGSMRCNIIRSMRCNIIESMRCNIICSERDAISSFGNVVRKTILKSDECDGEENDGEID